MNPVRQSLLQGIFWNILSIAGRKNGTDKKVPPVLLSGHHANIEAWRREQSILRTARRRPDLLKKQILPTKNGIRSGSGKKNGKKKVTGNKGAISMKTSDFYYDLPKELIAQDPLLEDRS